MEYVVLTVLYRDREIRSIPLPLEDNTDTSKLVITLSENGTNPFMSLKVPTSDTSFVIVSKAQLNESVVQIDVLTEEQANEVNKKRKK